MDTTELGAGYNPVPDEIKKTYQFEFNATISGYGVVTAKNYEDAKEMINNGDYDDIVDTWDMKIEEITNIEEE